MVLEIINSCLTHNLHNNPHLIYSLLYQREIFEPYRSHPSLMDLVQNMETVSINYVYYYVAIHLLVLAIHVYPEKLRSRLCNLFTTSLIVNPTFLLW